jgi:hypothetical protein
MTVQSPEARVQTHRQLIFALQHPKTQSFAHQAYEIFAYIPARFRNVGLNQWQNTPYRGNTCSTLRQTAMTTRTSVKDHDLGNKLLKYHDFQITCQDCCSALSSSSCYRTTAHIKHANAHDAECAYCNSLPFLVVCAYTDVASAQFLYGQQTLPNVPLYFLAGIARSNLLAVV